LHSRELFLCEARGAHLTDVYGIHYRDGPIPRNSLRQFNAWNFRRVWQIVRKVGEFCRGMRRNVLSARCRRFAANIVWHALRYLFTCLYANGQNYEFTGTANNICFTKRKSYIWQRYSTRMLAVEYARAKSECRFTWRFRGAMWLSFRKYFLLIVSIPDNLITSFIISSKRNSSKFIKSI